MGKIKKISISNFRNIKNIEIDVKKNPVIIQGDNNLGKSSILNAVNWFFTGTLLTDKWGVGENDIDSIIPIDQVKGEYVSVTITFESGIEFTKNYKTSWDSRTGKPKGHTTEGLINSSLSKNMRLWQDELEKEINFKQTLMAFNELRLFTDPLYALQKMEAKELRQLLVALGCEVSNEEVFEALGDLPSISTLKEQEAKYRGNFYDMRADYKRMVKADTESLTVITNQLRIYNDVEDYDKARFEELTTEIKGLRDRYYNLRNEDAVLMVNAAKAKLNELESAKRIYVQSKTAERNQAITEIEYKILDERHKIENEKKSAVKDKSELLASLEKEVDSKKAQRTTYSNSHTTVITSLTAASTTGKTLVENQKQLIVKLNAVKASTYNDMATCPVCMTQFAIDPVAQATFEANKQNEIVRLNNEIEKSTIAINNSKEVFLKLKEQRSEIESEIDKLNVEIVELENRIYTLRTEINQNLSFTPDDSTLSQLLEEKAKISQNSIDTSEYDNKIKSQEEEIKRLEENSSQEIEGIKADLSHDISTLELQLDEIKIQKSKWETKCDLQKKYDEAVAKRNDHEAILETINQVIHKTIEMCNRKAYEKTGFEFVMLEETLSETIKEVCYLVVDGVPFKDVNTSRKAIIGTLFISKVKNILEELGTPRNDLPILFDKLESISLNTLEKNSNIFDRCQFICTRVTESEVIEIC